MVRRIIAILSFFIVLASCNQVIKQSDMEGITLSLLHDNDCPSFCTSEFVDSVSFIMIDTTANLFSASSMKYAYGNFYISDDIEQNIKVINPEDGSVFCIGQQGRSKSEYINLSAFDVNPSNGDVLVYDQPGNKVIRYNSCGAFIDKFTLQNDQIFRDIAVLSNGDILCCTYDYNGPGAKRGVWLIDPAGHFKKQVIEVDAGSRFCIMKFTPYFHRINDELIGILGPDGDDSIYHIDDTGVVCDTIPIILDVKWKRSDLRKLVGGKEDIPDYYYEKHWYIENDFLQGIFIVYSKGKKNIYAYRNKSNGLIYILNKGKYINDIGVLGIHGAYEDIMYAIIGSGLGMTQETKEKFPHLADYDHPFIQILHSRK